MNIDNIKAHINIYQEKERSQCSNLLIVLVANVDGKTNRFDDYQNTSVLSEYYTLDEFEMLSSTLKKMGYEVLNYFSEETFMHDILNHKIHSTNKKILVINSAQTGIYVGRKSLIPAFCEYFKLMHTGSNPYVVSLCRDKFHTNAILKDYINNHMPTYLYSAKSRWLGEKNPQLGQKVIAKLNGESASIGLTSKNIFEYSPDAESRLDQLSEEYAQPVVVQPFISGYEIELPVLMGYNSFPLIAAGIKINGSEKLGDKFLDYNSRFYHTYEFYNYDDFNCSLADKIKSTAIQSAQILGIEGFGRIDFRITSSGEYYISDIATNPHITMDSSYFYVFKELGYSYSQLLSTLIGVTLSKYV